MGHFKYKKTNGNIGATALTYSDGTVRKEIAQGRIGTKVVEGEPMAKYLYDTKAFDSPLELENINADIAEVVVYGKIPRNSIAIPTVAGGTYSPDFMYVVKKKNGEKNKRINDFICYCSCDRNWSQSWIELYRYTWFGSESSKCI